MLRIIATSHWSDVSPFSIFARCRNRRMYPPCTTMPTSWGCQGKRPKLLLCYSGLELRGLPKYLFSTHPSPVSIDYTINYSFRGSPSFHPPAGQPWVLAGCDMSSFIPHATPTGGQKGDQTQNSLPETRKVLRHFKLST